MMSTPIGQTREPRLRSVVVANLRALKAINRVSDDEIARALGPDVKRSWVQERLSGKRELKIDDLEAFARVFGVSISRLLGEWYAPRDSNPEPNDSALVA